MLPLVAIVGRPNVGKSTLFNRLVRKRSALVADQPGLTRDRHYGRTQWEGRDFMLVDTGGFESDAEGIDALIREQTEIAIAEADVVVMLTDAREGLTSTDADLVERLRRSDKPVLHVANKVDGNKQKALQGELYELGVARIFPTSAEHALGLDDLIDAILSHLPKVDDDKLKRGDIRLSLVGRPNAGKSALLNRLVGEPRAIVSEIAGTTRDPIDAFVAHDGEEFALVDTAGIRRRRRGGPLMEQISVLRAMRSIEDCDVACLLIDGAAEVGQQDARIANLAFNAGKGLVVALSKQDIVDKEQRQRIVGELDDRLHYIEHVPKVWLSSLTGKGVKALLPTVSAVAAARGQRIQTSELNRFLEAIVEAHHPPAFRGRIVKLLYITQAQSHPPTFIVSTNAPDGLPDAYKRYVANCLRETYGFAGSPIRLFFRGKKQRANRSGKR